MNYLDALNWRYAVKQFSDEKITEQQITGITEVVRLTASAYGLQPYLLVVIESADVKTRLLPYSYGQNKVAECSHLLVLAHKNELSQGDIEQYISELAAAQGADYKQLQPYQEIISQDVLNMSAAQQANWCEHQCYIALGNLLSYLAMSKIDAAPMTGFDKQGVSQELGLDELGLSAAILCPIGVRSKQDPTADRPKYRKPMNDLVVMI